MACRTIFWTALLERFGSWGTAVLVLMTVLGLSVFVVAQVFTSAPEWIRALLWLLLLGAVCCAMYLVGRDACLMTGMRSLARSGRIIQHEVESFQQPWDHPDWVRLRELHHHWSQSVAAFLREFDGAIDTTEMTRDLFADPGAAHDPKRLLTDVLQGQLDYMRKLARREKESGVEW